MHHLLRLEPSLLTDNGAREHLLAAGLTPLATFPDARVVLARGRAAPTGPVQGMDLLESTQN